MAAPLVSFVVPCYRLARYLEECVETILLQSYEDLEVLIVDDASPDDTQAVAQRIIASHPGRRIQLVSHPNNLGHLRSYNDGILRSSGSYVWVLSPDDRLRSREILRRYVDLMEARPDIGYAFCPGHRIDETTDQGLYQRSAYAERDRIVDGHVFATDLVGSRFELLSPSVLIRRDCYTNITLFPEDLPHRADTYVWASIAMERNVGFFAEAMVDYRVHASSMMSTMARESPAALIGDDIAVLWRIRGEAIRRRLTDIARHCDRAIGNQYARGLMGLRVRGETVSLSQSELDDSLARFEHDDSRREALRCCALLGFGDRLYWSGRIAEARDAYAAAGRACRGGLTRRRVQVLARLGLAESGGAGILARRYLGQARRWIGAIRGL